MALEGDALLWFQREQSRKPLVQWEELRDLLLRQFRPTSCGSLHEQWLDHSQSTTVVDYKRKFIELLAPLTGVSEEIAKGLREDIRAEVRLLGPQTLDHAMDLSIKAEDKLGLYSTRQTHPSFNPHSKSTTYSSHTYSSPNSTKSIANHPQTHSHKNRQSNRE